MARRRGGDYPTEINTVRTSLRFTEEMKGYVGFGATDCRRGFEQGPGDNGYLEASLSIHIEGVDRFITTTEHEASIEGTLPCDRLGGRLPIRRGTFNLFVDEGDPTRKKVVYHILFDDARGDRLTLIGLKDLHDAPGPGVLSDTTMVSTKIYRGSVSTADEEHAELVAAGIIRVSPVDLLKQLGSFRVEGPTLSDRASTLSRFGAFYLGRLWDVYARSLLTSAPF